MSPKGSFAPTTPTIETAAPSLLHMTCKRTRLKGHQQHKSRRLPAKRPRSGPGENFREQTAFGCRPAGFPLRPSMELDDPKVLQVHAALLAEFKAKKTFKQAFERVLSEFGSRVIERKDAKKVFNGFKKRPSLGKINRRSFTKQSREFAQSPGFLKTQRALDSSFKCKETDTYKHPLDSNGRFHLFYAQQKLQILDSFHGDRRELTFKDNVMFMSRSALTTSKIEQKRVENFCFINSELVAVVFKGNDYREPLLALCSLDYANCQLIVSDCRSLRRRVDQLQRVAGERLSFGFTTNNWTGPTVWTPVEVLVGKKSVNPFTNKSEDLPKLRMRPAVQLPAGFSKVGVIGSSVFSFQSNGTQLVEFDLKTKQTIEHKIAVELDSRVPSLWSQSETEQLWAGDLFVLVHGGQREVASVFTFDVHEKTWSDPKIQVDDRFRQFVGAADGRLVVRGRKFVKDEIQNFYSFKLRGVKSLQELAWAAVRRRGQFEDGFVDEVLRELPRNIWVRCPWVPVDSQPPFPQPPFPPPPPQSTTPKRKTKSDPGPLDKCIKLELP
ncbi:hypothetical protein M3Y99_01491500 [Aphelenchoides fujianensis]|nr:hypothetical protein M3Y99_01491500 [Aphelenchoides fujianensis]